MSYLGALPDVLGVFGILFHHWQDAGRHDAMGATEVVIDLYVGTSDSQLQ